MGKDEKSPLITYKISVMNLVENIHTELTDELFTAMILDFLS